MLAKGQKREAYEQKKAALMTVRMKNDDEF